MYESQNHQNNYVSNYDPLVKINLGRNSGRLKMQWVKTVSS